MIINVSSDLTILNIFKDDNKKLIESFIRHHCEKYKNVIMLNTGNIKTFKYALEFIEHYPNLQIFFKEFDEIDFSAMRNTCLDRFNKSQSQTDYYCWVDTDEILEYSSQMIKIKYDITQIYRIDGSERFSTVLDRLYSKNVIGKWTKRIHEHFCFEGCYRVGETHKLKLIHLTSEANRPEAKKQLYFKLLEKEFEDGIKHNNRQIMIGALLNLIVMTSHDLKQPADCVKLYENNKELILSTLVPNEISAIQKLNMLIHILISYSRLQIKVPAPILRQIIAIDMSKSTMFQVLRGLAFRVNSRPLVKAIYDNEYASYPDEIHKSINNQDYKNEKEIAWLEHTLEKRNNTDNVDKIK